MILNLGKTFSDSKSTSDSKYWKEMRPLNKISENNCKEIKGLQWYSTPISLGFCLTNLHNCLDALIRDKWSNLLLEIESDLLPSSVLTGKDSAIISYMFGWKKPKEKNVELGSLNEFNTLLRK